MHEVLQDCQTPKKCKISMLGTDFLGFLNSKCTEPNFVFSCTTLHCLCSTVIYAQWYILRPKVPISHYTNPSNFAECKVAVTKIVSLLWMLADVDLQKQYKSTLEKAICSYFHFIICPSKSLFLPKILGCFDGPKKPSPVVPKEFLLGILWTFPASFRW